MSYTVQQARPARLIVAAALVNHSGCVLVQRRPVGKDMAGLWEFPGGKVEPGERLEEALARELKEELNIDIRPDHLVPGCFSSAQTVHGDIVLLLFLCRQWDGEPQMLHADGIKWLKPEALHTLAMPPADAPFIAYLERVL